AGTQRAEPAPVARLAAAVAAPASGMTIVQPPFAEVATLGYETSSPPEQVDDTRTYVVRKHDSWWGIAEHALGDGQRWRELRDLNAGRVMPDGSAVGPTTEVI